MEKILKEIYEELEIESVDKLELDTKLKDLDEWDSMTAMVLIGYFNDYHKLSVNSDHLKKMTSIESLLYLIEFRLDD